MRFLVARTARAGDQLAREKYCSQRDTTLAARADEGAATLRLTLLCFV